MTNEIKIHQGQTAIDFLKVENQECLKCLENQEGYCQSITCDWYNIPILEINEIKCIHKITGKRDVDDCDNLFGDLI